MYSCVKETSLTNNSASIVESRASFGCDGAPMAPPKILDDPSPYIENGACCFTLKFSPSYTLGLSYQIIGLDSAGNSLALMPYGYCVGTLSNSDYTVSCCITTIAASITISLNPSGPNPTCVEIPLPCK